jgi:hypothetical protein
VLVLVDTNGVTVSVLPVSSRDDWISDDSLLVGMNTDVRSSFILVVDSVNLVVVSSVVDFEYKAESIVDTFAVALIPGSNEDVAVPMEVVYEGGIVDNERYSLDFVVSPIILNAFAVVLLEIPLVSNINGLVDSFDPVDEIRSISEFELVVNIDVDDEIKSLFTVDNLSVCSIEESV